MKKLLLPFAVLVIAVACDDENSNDVTPTKTKLLTLQVDAGYQTTTNDWIVIHSEDGELLAFESFESNSVIELETDKPVSGTITTTTIRQGTSNGFNFYFVESHTNVQKGKKMVFKSYSTAPLGVTGEFNVSISDVTGYDQQSLTSRIGSAGSGSWSGGTNILQLNTTTHAGVTKFILSIDDKSSLKYKILENVKANDNISFSFLDMLPYDNIINFNFQPTSDVTLFVIGSEPDPNLYPNSYSLQAYLGNLNTRSTQRAGYLNSLTNYRTMLTITYPDYSLEYVNFGSIPNPNITWPQKSDFSITTSTINNFKASAKKPFAWRYSTWTYLDSQNNVGWTVYAPNDHQTIGELPAEILSQHPALALTKMTYHSTMFYTDAMSYEDLVDSDFAYDLEVPGSRVGIKTKGN